jgi:hypothetical protein
MAGDKTYAKGSPEVDFIRNGSIGAALKSKNIRWNKVVTYQGSPTRLYFYCWGVSGYVIKFNLDTGWFEKPSSIRAFKLDYGIGFTQDQLEYLKGINVVETLYHNTLNTTTIIRNSSIGEMLKVLKIDWFFMKTNPFEKQYLIFSNSENTTIAKYSLTTGKFYDIHGNIIGNIIVPVKQTILKFDIMLNLKPSSKQQKDIHGENVWLFKFGRNRDNCTMTSFTGTQKEVQNEIIKYINSKYSKYIPFKKYEYVELITNHEVSHPLQIINVSSVNIGA